jgi:hypothetical protein
MFISRWRNRTPEQREELFVSDPGLYYAYEAYLRSIDEPTAVLLMEARLLAKCTFEEIADACDTIPDTVEWYEALFFNVRDKLDARDWITTRVLVPAMSRNFGLLDHPHHAHSDDDDDDSPISSPWDDRVIARPFLDASLKMFAYFGGPLLCEFMIHGFQSGKIVSSGDNLSKFLDEHWALTIRARSAQAARTFTINKYNVLELFNTHSQILSLEKTDEALGMKQNAMESHISALIDNLPWYGGEDSDPALPAVVGELDKLSAEVRDGELVSATLGQDTSILDNLSPLKLPPPTEKKLAPPTDKGI